MIKKEGSKYYLRSIKSDKKNRFQINLAAFFLLNRYDKCIVKRQQQKVRFFVFLQVVNLKLIFDEIYMVMTTIIDLGAIFFILNLLSNFLNSRFPGMNQNMSKI